MRPFSELTERGKIRRLHGVARAALAFYGLSEASIRCIARETNTTFRVDTPDGRRLALRIQSDPDDTEVDTATEVAWLRFLEHSAVDAVRVVPALDGADLVSVEVPGVPGTRTCVLFSWVPGRPVGDDASPEDYHRLGLLAAGLHDHGERWQMPPGLHPLVWDRVFYYPTEPVVLYEERFRHHLTPERTRVVRAVEEIAAAELSRLHRERPVIVLHGDLHPWNVHTHRGRLTVFDFEDLMLGAAVQDIAITLFYGRDGGAYPEVRAAFQEGYSSVREWPVEFDGQLEILMAARTVSFINYVLRMDLDPDDHIPRMTERIRRVL